MPGVNVKGTDRIDSRGSHHRQHNYAMLTEAPRDFLGRKRGSLQGPDGGLGINCLVSRPEGPKWRQKGGKKTVGQGSALESGWPACLIKAEKNLARSRFNPLLPFDQSRRRSPQTLGRLAGRLPPCLILGLTRFASLESHPHDQKGSGVGWNGLVGG